MFECARRSVWLLAAATMVMALSACGGGGGGGGSAVETQSVGPAGGTLHFLNGTVQLVVPAGAVAGNVSITAKLGSTTATPAPIAGTLVQFGPDGQAFAHPVALTIKYDATKVPAGVAETDLQIAKDSSGSWLYLASTVDVTAKTVSASLSGFSPYGVTPPPPAFVKQFGSSLRDDARAVAADNVGNVYVGGTVTAAFAGKQPIGDQDAYVTSYTRDGQLRSGWPVRIGETGGATYVTDIAVDPSSNYIYVACDIEPASGDCRYFIASYTPSGQMRAGWPVNVPGRHVPFGYVVEGPQVGADASGNVYFAASASDAVGNGQTNAGYYDVFVTSYNSSGQLRNGWPQEFGSDTNEGPTDLAVTTSGAVYVVGYTGGSIFATNGGPSLSYYDTADAFLAVYDADGHRTATKQWAKAGSQYAVRVAVSNQTVYVSWFDQPVMTNPVQILALDTYLNPVTNWPVRVESDYSSDHNALAVDVTGNVFFAESFGGHVGVHSLNNSGAVRSGWPQQIASNDNDIALGIATSSLGGAGDDVYVVGQTQGTFTGTTSAGGQDAFVVRLRGN